MKYAISLIDQAAEICGSYTALAQRLDLADSHISQLRRGKRGLPDDCVPILADILHLDVHDTIDRVLLEKAKGTKREAALREILGKAVAAGVAGLLVFSYSGDSNSNVLMTRSHDTLINEAIHRVKWLARLADCAAQALVASLYRWLVNSRALVTAAARSRSALIWSRSCRT